MFEFDQYSAEKRKEPPLAPLTSYSAELNIERMSLLVWGEHCTECAAPECYKTCDLYEARADKRCRRFRFGVYKNRAFASLRGYGAEVALKKWGVVGAMGNT